MHSNSILEPSGSQKKLMEALNAPKVDAFLWNVENAAKGTFTWFLVEPAFRSWTTAKESSSLLIIGAPGQGKTVLSKFLLQHLKMEKQQNVMIIYFFCSDRDDSLKTVNSLLRSLVAQLLSGSPQIRKNLKQFEQDPATAADSNHILWEMFETAVTTSSHKAIYCLLDGLDELEKYCNGNELETFLIRLRDLLRTRTDPISPRYSSLKFLGTSRQIPEIVNKLQGLTRFDLKAHSEDLKIFVDQRILDLPESFGQDLREQAARLLMDEAKGTFFLWVSIVVKRFEKIDFPTVAGLKKTIKESSTDLNTLYDDLFRQIDQRSEFAQKLVVWVVYSKRPLTLRELEAALATQQDSKNEECTKDYKTALTSKSLASVLGVILESTTEGFVRLIHQSAKDFIIGRNLVVNSSFGTNIDPNVYIAKVCMTYLNFADFNLDYKDYKPKIEALKRSHPLLDYAARHWYSHIRDKSEVEHCFALLLQILTPPSVRFWSAVASITPRDANTRYHPLEVATNADIEWLATYLFSAENTDIEVAKDELEYAMNFGSGLIAAAVAKSGKLAGGELAKCALSNRNVGKEFVEDGLPGGIMVTTSMISEALGNWMKGNEQLEALAARHDVEFTPEAVELIAKFANENIMQSLLRTHPCIEVTKEVIQAASANQRHGGGVINVLLDGSKTFQLDAKTIKETASNKQSGMEVMGIFLDKQNVTMNEEAVALTMRNFTTEVVRMLVQRKDIIPTKKILTAASKNTTNGKEVMELLLSIHRHTNAKITSALVAAAASNPQCGKEVLKLLLSTNPAIPVTKQAGSKIEREFDREVMVILQSTHPDIQITADDIASIVSTFDHGTVKLLLSNRPDILITDSVVTAAAGNRSSGKEVMELLLSTHPDVQITKPIVTAAAGNSHSGKEVMELLLSTHPDIQITEPIVTAAAGNSHSGKKLMELLLSTHPDIQITEPIVTAAAGNSYSGKEVMQLLMSTHPDIQITEPILTAAAKNWGCSKEVMELLLSTHPDIQITEPIVTAAAGNSHSGKEVMELLLSTHPDIQITEPIVTAAAGNLYSGKEVLELLLSTHPDIQITEPIVTAAAGNSHSGKEVMELLLSTQPDIQITEQIVTAAAGNSHSGKKLMELLLSTHPDIQITAEAVAIIVTKGDHGIVKLLLSTHPDIQITEPILTAAAKNLGCSKEVMELLLSTHPDIQITEPIVTAAAENLYSGKEVLELLLSTHPDIQITEPTMTAAAGNSGSGKKVMELLLSTHPDIQITEPIVTAAAGNWSDGNEVMELLLSTHPDIQITEPIVTAAAWNSGSGKEVMEKLMANVTNNGVNPSAVKAAAYFGRNYWFGKLLAECTKASIVKEQYHQYLGAAVEGGDLAILKSLLDLGGKPSETDSSTSDWTLPMVATQSRNSWAQKQFGDVKHGSLNQPDPPTAWVNDYSSTELEKDDREIVYEGKSVIADILLN